MKRILFIFIAIMAFVSCDKADNEVVEELSLTFPCKVVFSKEGGKIVVHQSENAVEGWVINSFKATDNEKVYLLSDCENKCPIGIDVSRSWFNVKVPNYNTIEITLDKNETHNDREIDLKLKYLDTFTLVYVYQKKDSVIFQSIKQ